MKMNMKIDINKMKVNINNIKKSITKEDIILSAVAIAICLLIGYILIHNVLFRKPIAVCVESFNAYYWAETTTVLYSDGSVYTYQYESRSSDEYNNLYTYDFDDAVSFVRTHGKKAKTKVLPNDILEIEFNMKSLQDVIEKYTGDTNWGSIKYMVKDPDNDRVFVLKKVYDGSIINNTKESTRILEVLEEKLGLWN